MTLMWSALPACPMTGFAATSPSAGVPSMSTLGILQPCRACLRMSALGGLRSFAPSRATQEPIPTKNRQGPGRSVDVLVLTRRIGETLHIGDNITVTVLDVKGTQVRVGVVAPKDVRVDREEVRRRIEAELVAQG